MDIHNYVHESPKRQSWDLNQQTNGSSNEYEVVFKIKYLTEFGENLFVIGDVPQLGTKTAMEKYPLTWTDGHIWVSKTPLRTTSSLFRYKYVLIDERSKAEVDKKERVHRIADLRSAVS